MINLSECLPDGFPVEAVNRSSDYNRTYWAHLPAGAVETGQLMAGEPGAWDAVRQALREGLSRIPLPVESVWLDDPFRDQVDWSKSDLWYPLRVLGEDPSSAPFCLSPLSSRAAWNDANRPSGPAMLGRAQDLLARRNYAEGFQAYEFRWQTPQGFDMWQPWKMPMWDGKAPGKVLVWGEQGYGDQIMFSRYLIGRDFDYLCPPEMLRLMKTLATRGQVFDRIPAGAKYDYHLPLCSLPLALGLVDGPLKMSGFMGSYLHSGYSAYVGDKAFGDQRRRVGVCWAGRPEHPNDAKRSTKVNDLLRYIPIDCLFVNLQQGKAVEQLWHLPEWVKVLDPMPDCKDWADTAAAVMACDLVVTVDTAIAHLAGALGIPTKLILAGSDDWRWKNGQIWYPSIEIIPPDPKPEPASLAEHAAEYGDMAAHVGTLTRYASECKTVIEFGVRSGVSTWAILDGLPADGQLYSVDINPHSCPKRVTGDGRWKFLQADSVSYESWTFCPIKADMVFIDSSHAFQQTLKELHAATLRFPRRIVLHDGDRYEIKKAIAQFIEKYHDWHVTAYADPYGLTTLERK